MLINNYNAVQLFVSIVGLLGASLYFYKLNFLNTSSHLIFCFFLLGEAAGVFFITEKVLFLYMPINYLLLALFLTFSGQAFVSSVFLTIFAFAVDQFSRVTVDGLFLAFETDSFSLQHPIRWLAAFTMLRVLFFFMQKWFYDWFIYQSHFLQISLFFKNNSAFLFGLFFFIFFLSLKIFLGSSIVVFNRFYVTFSSLVFLLLLLFTGSIWIAIKKQRQQLQMHLEKKTVEESNGIDPRSKLSIRNFHKIEQLKNRWFQYYLIFALKKCQQKNIYVEVDIQEFGRITCDLMIIDAVRCFSIVFDHVIKKYVGQEKTYIILELYIEEQYFDCKIIHSFGDTEELKQEVEQLKKDRTAKIRFQEKDLNRIDSIISKYQKGDFYFKQSKTDFFAQFLLHNT